MMNLLLHIKHIDNICRHVIEDIDKSDKNSFGITYCDICVQKDIKGIYYLYCRFLSKVSFLGFHFVYCDCIL